ncbi:MAG: zinc-dependent alcohol dehydrogenase, partial [Bombilactobacillus sp.]
IMGSANSDGQDFFKALNLLNTGVIDVKPFIAGYTTFADIEAGMRRALDPETYRIILRMNQ